MKWGRGGLQVHFSAPGTLADILDDAPSHSSDEGLLSPSHCHLRRLVVGALPVPAYESALLIVA